MAELEGPQALEAAIAEIDRRIDGLQKARQVLVGLLGGSLPSVPHSSNSATPPTPTPTVGDPLALVREQEFHGMSMAEAALVFLKRAGSQKTGMILDALQKGGLEYKGKFPESALYTALSRHLAFVSLKKNWWDLAERRPDLAEQQLESKRRLRTPKKHRGKDRAKRMRPVEHAQKIPPQKPAPVGVPEE